MRRAAFLAVLVVAVACMRETPDVSQNAPSRASERSTANPQAGTGQDTTLNPTVPINTDSPTSRVPAAAEGERRVELLEYQIRMPDSVMSGGSPWRVVNSGKEKHGLALEGTSLRVTDVNPGQSAEVSFNVPPGTYTVYCPVDGHREKGMTKTVTVAK